MKKKLQEKFLWRKKLDKPGKKNYIRNTGRKTGKNNGHRPKRSRKMKEKEFVERVIAAMGRDLKATWDRVPHTVNLGITKDTPLEKACEAACLLILGGQRQFAYRQDVTPKNYGVEKLLEVAEPRVKLNKEMAKVWKKVFGELKAMSLAGTLDKKYKGVDPAKVAQALWKHPKVGNSQVLPDAELWTKLTANLAERIKPKAKGDFELELELDFS